MKKKLSLLFLLLAIVANAQIVNIPDANFKAKLLSSSPGNTVAKDLSGNYFAIDANGDGIIQVSEAQQVSQLNLAETSGASNISSLVGILSFTNLEILNIYYSNINSLNVQGLSNLKILNCRNNALSSINLQGCTALQKLICYTNALTVLDVHGLTNLQDLDCSGNPLTSLNVQGCTALQKLECIGSQLTVLDVHGLTNLQDLNCYSNYNGQLTSLNIQGCTSLQLLNCRNNSITSLNIQGFPNLQYLNCSDNPINILNVQGLTSLQTLYCANNQLTQLNVQGLTNLQNLVCSENQLTSLDVHNLTNLEILYCNTNQTSLLNAQGCVSLYELYCNNNQLSQLNLQGVDNIYYLDCSYNQLTSLSLSSPNTTVSGGTFKLNNNLLSTVNISSPYIAVLNVNNNQLTDMPNISAYSVDELFAKNNNFNIVNISNASLIGTINISGPITAINFSQYLNNPNVLEHLIIETSLNSLQINGFRGDISFTSFPMLSTEIKGNNLKDIDLSNYHKIDNPKKVYNFDTPNIKTLKMKDGFTNTLGGSGANTTLNFINPVVSNSLYICADDTEVTNFYNYLSSLSNLSNVNLNVNSYCSFVPGGSYNTITGLVRFDENNNGCDTNDEIFEHMKLKISDGTNTGETFVKNNGKYDFYTQAGNFTVTALPENPALFTVTPANFSTSFPNNNNNVFTQDLCVTKNGNANDLEVVIAPLTNAVPGFDAKYKVMWRNKGNTILSGNVTFTFNASKMDFVSSALPSAVSGNQVTFNFANLKPYANTASEVTFNIHPPTHPTNPANAGDQLSFMASLGPVPGDINPADNTFNYQQTVINSFDPNDIVCLEGSTIPAVMIGNYLHYVVNFENSGTAPATNIVVEMDINPADFDISSLQLQNASHQVYTKVTGNKAEFMMKSANLGSGGHGNILLKIKSKGTLNPGDQVMNKANIYFDYNFPIETNNAVTNIAGILKVEENLNTTSAEVYPNPTKGEVNISAESEIKAVEVYDNAGRIIQKQIGINARKTSLTIRNENTGVFYLKIITDKGSVMKK